MGMKMQTAADLKSRLQMLEGERALAQDVGLAGNELYMEHLLDDLLATRSAYVGLAVTELATLRGELGGRNQG
jgi:hypothetical protein